MSGSSSPSVFFTTNLNEVLTDIRSMKVDESSAVIFEIDNILLDIKGRIIKPLHEIFNLCVQKKLKIFIITSRVGTKDNINLTLTQLKINGITSYESIYFLKPTRDDVSTMKFKARKNLFDRGFKVVYTFGNDDSDGINCMYNGTFVKVTAITTKYFGDIKDDDIKDESEPSSTMKGSFLLI